MAKSEEDEPLDPVLENVRRKLMRLMMISIGILMVGLLGLLFAIVYKVSQVEDEQPEIAQSNSVSQSFQAQIELGLAKTTKIISSELNQSHLKLHVEMQGGAQEILIIDLTNGNTVSRVKLK